MSAHATIDIYPRSKLWEVYRQGLYDEVLPNDIQLWMDVYEKGVYRKASAES